MNSAFPSNPFRVVGRVVAVLVAAGGLLFSASDARADAEYWRDVFRSARDAGFVRVANFRVQAPVDERPAEFSADFLGPVADLGETRGATAWQLAAFGDNDGDRAAAFGLHYRFPPRPGGAAGVNAFADYYRDAAAGPLWRWSVGAEYRLEWGGFFANYYFPLGDRRFRRGEKTFRAEAAEGYDAEFRVRAPGMPWLSAVAGWANWNDIGDDGKNRDGLRYGARVDPDFLPWRGVRFALVRDDSRADGEELGAEFSLFFVVGKGWEFARETGADSVRSHFRPAERERRVFLREREI